MNRRYVIASVPISLLGTSLIGYTLRRRWIARWLDLPSAECDVHVEHSMAIPMPDGVVLLADRYVPATEGPHPTVLIRSPWGRGRAGAPFGLLYTFVAQRFAERGFQVLLQDTRTKSGGVDEELPTNEAADGLATLNWLSEQPWFDGNLGTWGASYLGHVQWALTEQAPPFLKALVPTTTSSRWYSFYYQDGALALERILVAMYMTQNKGQPLVELVRRMRRQTQLLRLAAFHLPLGTADEVIGAQPSPSFREVLRHPDADDPFWRPMDHRDALPRLTAAVHLVSAWHDIFLRDLLADYAVLEAAGRSPHLTIGPGHHVSAEVGWLSLREGLAWFDGHLKVRKDRLRARPVRIFIMGAQEWRDLDGWPPPAQETRYFLHSGARLATDPPADSSPPDQYRYDPGDPTPAIGGALMDPRAGAVDNSVLEARSDVLTYTSQRLQSTVEIVGLVHLVLYVRSTSPHTDFFGRLCDVAPDGRSVNVCDGLFRASPGVGETLADGTVRVVIDLSATAYRFSPGHRIRLQVSGGAHPRWSRNLGSGEPLATGTHTAVAVHTVYHDHARPSSLVVPVVT